MREGWKRNGRNGEGLRFLEVIEEVCGTRKIQEGKRRKESEEIRRIIGRKKECILIWRRIRT